MHKWSRQLPCVWARKMRTWRVGSTLLIIGFVALTSGFTVAFMSWFAPAQYTAVQRGRVVGPALCLVGAVILVLSVIACAVQQGSCLAHSRSASPGLEGWECLVKCYVKLQPIATVCITGQCYLFRVVSSITSRDLTAAAAAAASVGHVTDQVTQMTQHSQSIYNSEPTDSTSLLPHYSDLSSPLYLTQPSPKVKVKQGSARRHKSSPRFVMESGI